MPKVLNIKNATYLLDSVFIGRPSKWGNPFVIGKDGTREEVIEKYRQWVKEQPESFIQEIKTELKGKNLICYCAPKACHGDVLLPIANDHLIIIEF